MRTGEICASTVPGQPSADDDEFCSTPVPRSEPLPYHQLEQWPQVPNSWVIYKVPNRLRLVNEKAYEPSVISIGPYHHGKERLKEMEDIKKSFFDTTAGESREYLRTAIREEEERIRKCYVETNGLTPEQLVEMVVLDGFFIVQLLRGTPPIDLLQQIYILSEIFNDLLLLENQLPFFVLEKIYKIMSNNEETREFIDLSLRFFKALIGKTESSECLTPKEKIKHLLGLIHDTPRWRPSSSNGTNIEHRIVYNVEETGKSAKRENFIGCARDLDNAGIGFERRSEEEEKCRALDIEFNGNCRKPKLRIPKLEVSDTTEVVLRNLIAFEQFLSFREHKYVLDYVKFLDQLINSEQDVQLLCNSGIIENFLGDDKAVAKVFNGLRDNTYQSPYNFYYSDIFEQVNDHCNSSWNKHMANLHRTYFNSPWALLSFLAALILLFLTFAQTTFTLFTDDCPSCVVLYIVLGLLFAVIGLFVYMRFG